MPEAIIPDAALPRGLRWTLRNGDTELTAWELLLFVNDITPTRATVLADLTEPSWGGYSRVPLAPAGWSDATVDSNVATSTWGTLAIEFLNSGGPAQTVYGCALYDPGNALLQFVQRFDPGDIREIADGASVFIVPRYTRRSFGA